MATAEAPSTEKKKKGNDLFLWIFIGINVLMALFVVYKIFFS